MRKFWLALIVALAAMSLCAADVMSAAGSGRGGGQSRGGYSGGGHYGGSYRSGGHYRGYYGGGRHYRSNYWAYYGGPYWGWDPWPWYYPFNYYPYYSYYPYYPYYAPSVTVPAAPQEYIERSEPDEPAQMDSGVWYYCPGSKSYYPYVKECPGGWKTVPARPPSGTGR